MNSILKSLLSAGLVLQAGFPAGAALDYHVGKTPTDLDAQPAFTVGWLSPAKPTHDLSFLLEAPAGKDGHIATRNGRLVYPDGRRFRVWGVNATGAGGLPEKQNAAQLAARLACLGVNCVRFHMLDRVAPGGLIAANRADTRQLDPAQMDKLDFFIAELKQRGIYTDLNLNVGRTYKAGDGDPTAPRRVGGCAIGAGIARRVAVSGTLAYVTSEFGGIHVMDVGNPMAPRPIGGNGSVDAFGVAVVGDQVRVGAGADGVVGLGALSRAPELSVRSLTESPGSVAVRLSGLNGLTGRLQRSTNHVDWDDGLPVFPDGPEFELRDATITNAARFYRFVSP